MARPSARWLDGAKPLPGRWVTRALIVVAILGLTAVDVSSGEIDLATPTGWIYLIAPNLPLIALLIGAIPAAITLLAVIAALLVALATVASEYQIAQLTFPAAIVVGFCTVMLPLRTALVFAPTAVILLSLAIVVYPTPLTITTVLLQVLLMSAAAGAGLGLNVYGRRNDRSTAQIRTLQEEQARIRGDERTTLAYELHDIIAHDVTIIAMQTRRAALVDDPEKTAQIIEGIGDSAQQALTDLRSLVLLLRDDSAQHPTLEDDELLGSHQLSGATTTAAGLAHDIDGVADALQRAGFDVEFTIEGELALVPASLRQALRRTIRELGTNVLKHADPAHPVELKVAVGGGAVLVSTTNIPATARPITSSSTGIEAMRARCEVFGGSVVSGMTEDRWRTQMTLSLDGVPQPPTYSEDPA